MNLLPAFVNLISRCYEQISIQQPSLSPPQPDRLPRPAVIRCRRRAYLVQSAAAGLPLCARRGVETRRFATLCRPLWRYLLPLPVQCGRRLLCLGRPLHVAAGGVRPSPFPAGGGSGRDGRQPLSHSRLHPGILPQLLARQRPVADGHRQLPLPAVRSLPLLRRGPPFPLCGFGRQRPADGHGA